ncbi:unnamed protein product, partial [Laminaria digitata]
MCFFLEQKTFGEDLSQAWLCIRTYQARTQVRAEDSEGWRLHSSAVHHLNKAWEKYYVVFRNINKHLPQA